MQSHTVEIKKEFVQRSERVKAIDLHPTEPWMLLSLYSGTVSILNYLSRELVKSIKITESPVRTARFIARKQWIVVGADDKFIRVYNYNTSEKVVEFEAHSDYIRSLDVHPSLPYVLSASDDKLIKLWDWEKDWACDKIFEGHTHYVMQAVFNPRDSNAFASVSLDRTAKMWNVGSTNPHLTLEGHSKGLNCVKFLESGDKLITGSDDQTVKIWNFEDGTCVETLEGHTNNVTSVLCFGSDIGAFIITGSEDGTVRVWNSTNYQVESAFSSELGRVWAIGRVKSSQIVLCCDDGIVIGEVVSAST